MQNVPWEVNAFILSHLENPSDVLAFSLVSHYHHSLSIPFLYKMTRFFSIKQRDSFFEQIIDPSKPTDDDIANESNNDSAVDVSFSSSQSESSCSLTDNYAETTIPISMIKGIDFCLDHPHTTFEWTSHHITNELLSLTISPLASHLTILNIAGNLNL